MSEIVDTLSLVIPAEGVAGPEQGLWTYDDYAQIPDDGHRYEVVEGVLYMSPAPNLRHQSVSAMLTYLLMVHVQEAGLGRVFAAPCDVELAPNTVVQPDLLVVLKANAAILHPSRVIGAPDLVIEIASPSTATHDRRTKLEAYARAGVPEYWIVVPESQTVELLFLDAAKDDYAPKGIFRGEATLPSHIVSNLPVQVSKFFV